MLGLRACVCRFMSKLVAFKLCKLCIGIATPTDSVQTAHATLFFSKWVLLDMHSLRQSVTKTGRRCCARHGQRGSTVTGR